MSLYFVMEHVPNGSLSGLLEQLEHQGYNMPYKLVKFYTAWIVLALEYIHSKNIVHRDLKPQNILVDEQYYLKIVNKHISCIID